MWERTWGIADCSSHGRGSEMTPHVVTLLHEAEGVSLSRCVPRQYLQPFIVEEYYSVFRLSLWVVTGVTTSPQ
jgi:hypothetical protein